MIVGCFFDPGIPEARSVVEIPVIGLAESSLMFAGQMGRKMAVITTRDRKVQSAIEDVIDGLMLRGRMHPNAVRGIDVSDAMLYTRGMKQPQEITAAVAKEAELAASQGADVVVVGCNALGPLCTLHGLVRCHAGGAPIVDCVSVGLKLAEMFVSLRNSTRLPAVGRGSVYARPDVKELNRIRNHFGLPSMERNCKVRET